ncbi:flagellar L-ring protein precursor FlgH [Geothermobacter ehrlichii]|uniref:Flagellar L-ring protein n=1 Tax=Geothermobacter ehrlichii TaxID=213224 RepID=A0A5D3WNS5_9BACT|nr:flagellar basal body L-ring protein FlgH [Geothermobacter ehrlichii]TYP00185.1 flagellar L-ring protein precursor FlgH [Geothermobacter ehrlichii]
MKRTWLMIALVLPLAACAPPPQAPPPQLRGAIPAPPSPPPPDRPAGSIWADRGGDLFTDLKARRVGDIVTVAIYERASASKEATTETDRSSSISADITKFFRFEKDLAHLASGIDPAKLLSASYKNDFQGGGKTTRKEDLVATLTTQVVEVLPNGNLRIEGNKAVTVNNETQYIQLTGLVRPTDITSGNIVDSKYILDARIAYTGKGVVSDKQKPGWMTRVLDNIWPF